MTLHRWVELKGGAVKVAKLLGINKRAVYYWLDGFCFPHWRTLVRIQRLSKGQITMESFPAAKGRRSLR